jgi:tetratricopeptide (TPR) repeat protein
MRAGRLAEAEKEFREAARINPADVDARANVGAVQFLRNDWAGAAETLHKVLKEQPSLWKSQTILGLCERRLGHQSTAYQLLETAIPHLPLSPFRINAETELLEGYYQAGDLDKAVDVLRLLQNDSPTSVDTLYIADRLYTDLANRAHDSMLLVAPDSARMHQLMAQHLINRGAVPEAIAQYRKALEADPKLRGVRYELGEAILQDSTSAEALGEAEKEFSAAAQEDPSNANAVARLGTVAILRSNFERASEYCSGALRLSPNNALGEECMGRALVHLGKQAEAVAYLVAASQNNPLDSGVHYKLAMVYRELGRAADAEKELSQFRKLQEATQKIRNISGEMRKKIPVDSDVGAEP